MDPSLSPLDVAPLDVATAVTGEFSRLLPEIVRHVSRRLDRLETFAMALADQIASLVSKDAVERQDIAAVQAAVAGLNAAFAAKIASLQAQIDAGQQVDLSPLLADRDDAHAALQAILAGLQPPATDPATPPATNPPATDPPGAVTGTGEDTGVVPDEPDPSAPAGSMPAGSMPGM